MKNIYSSADIFLKMSKVEGFFGPPMEAMACGCAVVVSKVTGYDEYIKHNFNALVVESGDVSGAREAIKKLLIDSDLSESTSIIFLNGFIGLLIFKLKLLDGINTMKIEIRNNVLLLLMILIIL